MHQSSAQICKLDLICTLKECGFVAHVTIPKTDADIDCVNLLLDIDHELTEAERDELNHMVEGQLMCPIHRKDHLKFRVTYKIVTVTDVALEISHLYF